MDALVDGFLASFSRMKQADASEVPEGIAAGAALGGSVGAVLPFLLNHYRHRVPARLLDRQFTTHMGTLAGGGVGGFVGKWLSQALRRGQEGFRVGTGIFPQTETKKADETFKGIGTGALAGAGISAGSILPVLFGRLGKRLPTRVLNKMLLGRALSGAAIGAAAGGIAAKSRPKDNVYHYYYHKSLKEKGIGE